MTGSALNRVLVFLTSAVASSTATQHFGLVYKHILFVFVRLCRSGFIAVVEKICRPVSNLINVRYVRKIT